MGLVVAFACTEERPKGAICVAGGKRPKGAQPPARGHHPSRARQGALGVAAMTEAQNGDGIPGRTVPLAMAPYGRGRSATVPDRGFPSVTPGYANRALRAPDG